MAQHYVPMCCEARLKLAAAGQSEQEREGSLKRLWRKVVDYAKHHSKGRAGRRTDLSE